MTPDQDPEVPAPTGEERPQEQRYRELGVRLLQRINTMVRVGRAYKVGNTVFGHQVTGFLELVGPPLDESNELVLAMVDTDFYLNGYRLPIRPIPARATHPWPYWSRTRT